MSVALPGKVGSVMQLLALVPAISLSPINLAAAEIRMLSEPLEQHHTIEDMIGQRTIERAPPDQMLPLPSADADHDQDRKRMLGYYCRTSEGIVGPGAAGPVGSACVGNGNYGRIVRIPD
jgi:hypothetical protein